MDNSAGYTVLLGFVVSAVAVNFIPWAIAKGRRMSGTGALFAVNMLFGWTLIGWLACLLWAALGRTEDEAAFYRYAYAGQAARRRMNSVRIEPHI